MKKKLSIILIVSMLMTLFCTGFAYADSVSIGLNQTVDFKVLSTYSYGLQLIANSLDSRSTKHGAVLYYKLLEYTKHQSGQVFYTYKYKVVDVGTY